MVIFVYAFFNIFFYEVNKVAVDYRLKQFNSTNFVVSVLIIIVGAIK